MRPSSTTAPVSATPVLRAKAAAGFGCLGEKMVASCPKTSQDN